MPLQEDYERVVADPSQVVGGCALTPESWATECQKCGYQILVEGGHGAMPMWLVEGETFLSEGRSLRVSALEVQVLPRVRIYLIGVARRREQVTYGELKDGAELPHAVNGLGHLLDVLSEECIRRDEPSLAALVVNGTTGRVGRSFEGDAEREMAVLYDVWSGA